MINAKKTCIRHNWQRADDEAALQAYLTGLSKKEADKIAQSRGIEVNSFWMRVQNFKALATNGKHGLSNYSNKSKKVWEAYKKGSDPNDTE